MEKVALPQLLDYLTEIKKHKSKVSSEKIDDKRILARAEEHLLFQATLKDETLESSISEHVEKANTILEGINRKFQVYSLHTGDNILDNPLEYLQMAIAESKAIEDLEALGMIRPEHVRPSVYYCCELKKLNEAYAHLENCINLSIEAEAYLGLLLANIAQHSGDKKDIERNIDVDVAAKAPQTVQKLNANIDEAIKKSDSSCYITHEARTVFDYFVQKLKSIEGQISKIYNSVLYSGLPDLPDKVDKFPDFVK